MSPIPPKDGALDVLVVGLGRGGGRVAGELSRRGYRTMVLHSSRRALEEQAHVPKDKRHFIGSDTAHGTGGDPAVGKRFIRDQSRRIQDLIRSEGRDAALVLITAGLGNGTGSAVGELVASLDRGIAPVVVLATLPTEGATSQTKVNAVRAVRDLSRADLDGLILVDNARLTDMNADVSILEYHDRINEKIVEPLDALNRIESRDDLRAVQGIDGRRLMQILGAGGVLNYSVSELETLSADEVSNAVTDSLYSSWVVAAGIEPSSISTLQIVLEVPESVLAKTPVRLVEQLREQWKADTEGATIGVSIYCSGSGTTKSVVRTFATCSALPARVQQLVSEAAKEAKVARDKSHRIPELDLGELDDDGANGAPSQPIERKRRDSGWVRSSASISMPSALPLPSPITSPGVSTPSSRRERDITPAANRIDEMDEDVPGRAAYSRIVTRYRNTTNDELRMAIARRLEQDRLSERAQVRYHAVDAMVKIGVPVFEAALVAATEDEDPAVRSLAEQALEDTTRRRAV